MIGSLDVIGLVALGRGRLEEARRWLEESLASGRRIGEAHVIMTPLWSLAEVDLLAGDPAAASTRCDEGLELALTTGERALLIPFVVSGTRAWLALQRPDEAERWLNRMRPLLRGWENVAGPALAHADGLLRLAAGSLSAARDALESAQRGWLERGRIWEASWARLDLASCLIRSNRFAESAALLVAVRETTTGLDSAPILARIEELSRVAHRHGSLDEPWRPLTSREFEVARLIAEGLTNGEIAGALAIAPKTASAHVEHILAKLDVSRRAEIATWVANIAVPTSASARPDPAVFSHT